MDAPAAERIWRALLPPQAFFSAGGEPASVQLSPAERRSVRGAGALRLREFTAGRWHAKRALAALGLRDVDLPRRADGAPAWPDGVVGSVSHAWHRERVVVIAVVARADGFADASGGASAESPDASAAAYADAIAAIGVDLEPPGQLAPRTWPTLLSAAELAQVMARSVAGRSAAVRALWCAKEAVSKTGGAARDLRAIEVAPDAGGRFDDGVHAGRVLQEGGWTFAAAIRRAR